MKFLLTRTKCDKDGCFGELKNEKFEIVAYCAEHAYDDGSGNFLPKVQPGKYTCSRGMHQLHSMRQPFETFQIMNVPGHTNILIHPGNFPQVDSDGCLLVGEAISPSSKGPMVTNSRMVWQEFMDSCKGLDEIQLEVV